MAIFHVVTSNNSRETFICHIEPVTENKYIACSNAEGLAKCQKPLSRKKLQSIAEWFYEELSDCMNMDDSSQATITTPSSISFSIVFISTILCAIFLTNLLGNTCTCLVLFHARSLREKPSSLLLFSLAVCDLFALLLPLFSLILLYDLQAACNVSRYFIVLVPALFFINIVHICLLSVDRYIAIVHPLRYNVNRELKQQTFAIHGGQPELKLHKS